MSQKQGTDEKLQDLLEDLRDQYEPIPCSCSRRLWCNEEKG